jgi:UrcA family protein
MTAINPKSESVLRPRAAMFVGCLLMTAASLAQAAAPAGDSVSLTVRYADLNMATEEGANQLYSRISKAARAVCERDDLRDLSTFAASKACESAAIARAVTDVHSPRLAATYAARIQRG